MVSIFSCESQQEGKWAHLHQMSNYSLVCTVDGSTHLHPERVQVNSGSELNGLFSQVWFYNVKIHQSKQSKHASSLKEVVVGRLYKIHSQLYFHPIFIYWWEISSYSQVLKGSELSWAELFLIFIAKLQLDFQCSSTINWCCACLPMCSHLSRSLFTRIHHCTAAFGKKTKISSPTIPR